MSLISLPLSAIANVVYWFRSEAIGLIVEGIVAASLMPVLVIEITSLYFDLRARKEQYSLDKLAHKLHVAPMTT